MLQSIDAKEEARVLRKQGNSLAQNNQPAAALDCFERSLRLSPGDALTLNDRGNALQDLQRLEEALSSYDHALSIQPEFPAALTNRSNVFRTMRRLDEALRDLDAARTVLPTDDAEGIVRVLGLRARALRGLARIDEAFAAFAQALEIAPSGAARDAVLQARARLELDLFRGREALADLDPLLASARSVDLRKNTRVWQHHRRRSYAQRRCHRGACRKSHD